MEQVKIKNWYKEIDNKYSIMMSDDIDSLATSVFLKNKFGCHINLFNTFSEIRYRESVDVTKIKKGEVIAVDLDLSKNKCFGNHVTYVNNANCISLNKDINRNNYYQKFAGSTLLTVLSLYRADLCNCTTEQLEVLISIDTAFKQYFFNKDLFEYYYRDVLEYPIFVDIVANRSKDYFYNIIKKYKLHSKIEVENGYFKTDIELDKLSKIFNIDLSLPTKKFVELVEFQNTGMSYNSFANVEKEKIFSSALTSKNFVCATIR